MTLIQRNEMIAHMDSLAYNVVAMLEVTEELIRRDNERRSVDNGFL